jgi:hypothetical protein
MPPSAETIGALAAALAKAQTEADQPGEVAHRHPARGLARRSRSDLPLCTALSISPTA